MVRFVIIRTVIDFFQCVGINKNSRTLQGTLELFAFSHFNKLLKMGGLPFQLSKFI